MSKEFRELMQICVINEDIELSNMIKDIVPKREQKFTDIELEINKNENFSLVIYKEQTFFSKIISKIKISIEKLKIIKASKLFNYIKD